jgi:hypothetical protein
VKVIAVIVLILLLMNTNVITGIVIAGQLYNVVDGGVKCTDCAIRSTCLKGLGDKVQFDCASVHLAVIR